MMGKRSGKKKSHGGKQNGAEQQQQLIKDKDLPTTECPGTFRWTQEKQFPSMPMKFPSSPFPPVSSFKGWADYLMFRGGKEFMFSVKNDPSLIDCLSFPVTALSMMSSLKLEPSKVLHFVSLGASRRAEEFTFRNTQVWLEIANHFPDTDVRIYFVGPETSATEPIFCHQISNSKLTCHVVKGTLEDLKSVHPEIFNDLSQSLFCVFNGGEYNNTSSYYDTKYNTYHKASNTFVCIL